MTAPATSTAKPAVKVPQRIEIKNVKHAEFASDETACFEATVYLDGVRVGHVSNDGRGGCHLYHPWSVQEPLNAYAATLPPEVTDFADPTDPDQKFTFQPDADSVIDRLLTDFLVRRDLQKLLAKKVVYIHSGGKVYTTRVLDKARLALVLTKPEQFKDAKAILNLLPFDEALKLYREAA